MEAGEILEAEVIPEAEGEETPEEEGTLEEEGTPPYMTNYQDNNRLLLKGTDESQKPSCKNGTYIMGSIDTPLK